MALGQLRVLLQHARRQLAGPVEQHQVLLQVGKAQHGSAGLACAQEFAWAADLQVAPRDLEAVVGLGHGAQPVLGRLAQAPTVSHRIQRSEEHTSELQSPCNLVCRLLLEKKKNKT